MGTIHFRTVSGSWEQPYEGKEGRRTDRNWTLVQLQPIASADLPGSSGAGWPLEGILPGKGRERLHIPDKSWYPLPRGRGHDFRGICALWWKAISAETRSGATKFPAVGRKLRCLHPESMYLGDTLQDPLHQTSLGGLLALARHSEWGQVTGLPRMGTSEALRGGRIQLIRGSRVKGSLGGEGVNKGAEEYGSWECSRGSRRRSLL